MELDKIKSSLEKLNIKKIHTVLIHNPSQIKDYFDILKIKKILSNYNSNVGIVGASINSPDEYNFLKSFKFFKVFQVPYNILDKRWDEILKKKNKDIEIHARSIFLQGLLLTHLKNCPTKLKKEFNEVRKKISYLKKKFNRFDEKDLLFTYINQNSQINKILVGIEKKEQIEQIPFYLLRRDLTKFDMKLIKSKIPNVSGEFLTPSKW